MSTILTANNQPVEAYFQADGTWQHALKHAIRSGRHLCELLQIDPRIVSSDAESDFAVFVPMDFVQRMTLGDENDPLFRQVIAGSEELRSEGSLDPVGDLQSLRHPGYLQKYRRRALLIASGACAIHCRYCFRRHFPYENSAKGRQGWTGWLHHLRQDSTIDEVILSGGDPLMVADETLQWFSEQLNSIPHIKRLRIHTRLPVVIPQRVCTTLLDGLNRFAGATYLVLHINHANEIDARVQHALRDLRMAGITLLNQAVLLRGINDSVSHQMELCLRLIDNQVLPYYLHQLDPVKGALHFEVEDQRARQIVSGLTAQLPGYAVPKLVRENPGEPSKSPV